MVFLLLRSFSWSTAVHQRTDVDALRLFLFLSFFLLVEMHEGDATVILNEEILLVSCFPRTNNLFTGDRNNEAAYWGKFNLAAVAAAAAVASGM